MAATKTETRHAAGIDYTLTRRRVRNINLRVRADGSVAASASPRVPAGWWTPLWRPGRLGAFPPSARWPAGPGGMRPPTRRCPPKRRPCADDRPLPGILSTVRGQLSGGRFSPHRRAGHAHPVGVLQPENRHAGLQPAAVCDTPRPPRNMLWYTNSATSPTPTTARPSGRRWRRCCRTIAGANNCCGELPRHMEVLLLASSQKKYTTLVNNTLLFALSNFSSKLLSFFIRPYLSYALDSPT